MARPKNKKTLGTVDNPGGTPPDEFMEEAAQAAGARRSPIEKAEEADEMEILQRLRDESGNGGYVRLSRRIDGAMEYAEITRIEIAEYSLERVQQVYGGGYYKLKFFTATHKHCGTRRLIIDPSIPFKNPAAAAATPAAPAGSTDLVELARVLREKTAPTGPGENTLVSLFTLMMQSQQQAQASADARFEKILTAMSANAKPAGPDPLTLKLLDLTLAQKQTPVSELMETFSAFKRITGGGKADDEEEPQSAFERILTKLAPVGLSLLEKYTGGGMPAGGPVLREITGGAGPDGQPAAQPAETIQPIPPMNLLIKHKVNEITRAALSAAEAGADPHEFAAGVLDAVPPLYYDNVEKVLAAEDWFASLYGDAPPEIKALAEKNRAWLQKMRDDILAELKDEEAAAN